MTAKDSTHISAIVVATSLNATMSNKEFSPIEHVAREYHEYPGAQYALPTDDAERKRLWLQHTCIKTLFDNRILLAPVTLAPEDRVLDSGTGPGLWALDLAQSVDSAVNILGIDIASRLFPLSPPKNVAFEVGSVTNLPLDWSDTFTLVHQRLLMLALQTPEWPQALREIYRVLRPGGWVQLAESIAWFEGEYPEKPCMMKLVSLYRCLTKSRNLYIDCASHMPAMLAEAGFVDIQAEERPLLMGQWAGADGVANATTNIGVFRGIKTPVLEAGGYGKVTTEAEYDALVEGLEREWEEIPGTKKEFVTFWARKPEN
ncbi:S-adenosyl-L-methionine-dependent methyltransferase [Mycena albidolilacea]|uniref:S-adenosyl-L-methionine-dependent methyltransferase n=1 Tax=Mycena albidolilacea TaxID=1033008 RepID=A0AAD7A291_9AGAR|nr:S-adenosyl-L-methionine-dependent methyltransferase [Mycena albidolilacea]